MRTYKLGNKIDCIIRSFSSGLIGDEELIFVNQPYTVLKDVKANISFKSSDANAKTSFSQLHYNVDSIDEITISDVELNNKILSLIFSKNEEKMFSQMQNCEVENNKLSSTVLELVWAFFDVFFTFFMTFF